jgi:hypothetical protein
MTLSFFGCSFFGAIVPDVMTVVFMSAEQKLNDTKLED